ncbi:MAG: ATP-binding protein [Proteobacteria bacterium]|nr:ATP-binding protein [Pseudomonadota bacterium]
MSTDENEQIDEELRVSITLENFNYSSSAEDDRCEQSSMPRFLGRVREKSRLLDHLKKGKYRSGSFLVAGYRGVGKTEFVSEVLCNYKKGNGNFIEVKVNLGNDGDLTSKSVLFNMVYLLNNALREKHLVKCFEFLFGNIFRSLFLFVFFIIALFSLALFLSTSSHIVSLFDSFFNGEGNLFLLSIVLFNGGGNLLLLIIIFFLMLIPSGKFPKFPTWNAFIKLKKLQQRIYSTIDSHAEIKSNFFGFGKRRASDPLTTNQIEAELKDILRILRDKDVIFIFDELDKLSGRASDRTDVNLDLIKESKLRKQQVDSILGDLKNLITSSNARYIFIAGRDMYDAYLSERGSSNSLYESLFNDHIYIPSLLTDRSNGEIYLLDSMIEAYVVCNLMPKHWINSILTKHENNSERNEKHNNNLSILKLSDYTKFKKEMLIKDFVNSKNKRQERFSKEDMNQEIEEVLLEEIYILKTLIHFLTLHSWGNCKRLFTLFESFVRKEKGQYELYFSTRDIQRLVLSSQLYIRFHHNLSRMLMNADDKLVVSSFSIFHYILKYHSIGFSREHILRMYETINIHSSPELVRIVDIIIHNVLLNHVRRIRNGFYQYRFTFLHEKEIHFITTINDGESAAFNFSLNAMDAVKQHYKNLITESKQTHADDNYGHGSLASIHVIVGNFHFWEQSFDEALIHYGIALDMLRSQLEKINVLEKLDLSMQMVEIYLKQGLAEERVINFTAAATAYLNAEILADECSNMIENGKATTLRNRSNLNDHEWEILNQPKWAKLYLNLKLGNNHTRVHMREKDAVSIYKQAVLSFFMEDYCAAYEGFVQTTQHDECREDSENICSLKGNAYLRAALSLLLNYSSELHKRLKKDAPKKPQLNIDCKGNLIDKELNFLRDELEKISNAFIPEFKAQVTNFSDIHSLDHAEMINSLDISKKLEDREIVLAKEVIKLLNLSALSFEKGRLYSNATISYLSMVMIWEAFLEMIPWIKHDADSWTEILNGEDYRGIQGKIREFREVNKNNWIFTALQKALEFIGKNTGDAYHHSMKSVLERNLEEKIWEYPFFQTAIHREKILKNENLLFQQYSLMGQVIAASIFWEEIANESAIRNDSGVGSFNLLSGSESNLLPFGIRYYSMMLWLRGRHHLTKLLRNGENVALESLDENNCTAMRIPEGVRFEAANAIINLFRASQYVIKTHGETSNMILPPLFVVYYNMWEVLFYLVEIYLKQLVRDVECVTEENALSLLERAIYSVRHELHNILNEKKVKDVSSRMLDLTSVQQMTQEQFRIIEQMRDLTSSDRINILKNKYYLDDDFEDNMFILDWSYCRFYAPGAIIYPVMIEYKMKYLESLCFEVMSKDETIVTPQKHP